MNITTINDQERMYETQGVLLDGLAGDLFLRYSDGLHQLYRSLEASLAEMPDEEVVKLRDFTRRVNSGQMEMLDAKVVAMLRCAIPTRFW